jgi:hypothetical protein
MKYYRIVFADCTELRVKHPYQDLKGVIWALDNAAGIVAPSGTIYNTKQYLYVSELRESELTSGPIIRELDEILV